MDARSTPALLGRAPDGSSISSSSSSSSSGKTDAASRQHTRRRVAACLLLPMVAALLVVSFPARFLSKRGPSPVQDRKGSRGVRGDYGGGEGGEKPGDGISEDPGPVESGPMQGLGSLERISHASQAQRGLSRVHGEEAGREDDVGSEHDLGFESYDEDEGEDQAGEVDLEAMELEWGGGDRNQTLSEPGRRLDYTTNGRIEYAGEGGTLLDGRSRCFYDGQGDLRCYPTVFFFGTSKCGTTSLARWLDRHPATHWVANPRRPNELVGGGVKEAHVFDDSPKGTRKDMLELHHEKLLATSPKVDPSDVVIDYTPHYMAVSEVPHRIADLYGLKSGLKFIATLREPVSRTISSWEFKNMYNSKKQRRDELRSLETTVSDGKRRASKLASCVSMARMKKMTLRDRDLKLCNPRKFLELPLYVSHVGKSMYAIQLERWFSLFGRENFKVVFMDDMAVNPVGVLEEVLNFLGLDLTDDDGSKRLPTRQKWNWITAMAYNKTKAVKKDELSEQVTEDVKEDLRKFFEPHNRKLEELLGYPVPDSWT